MEGNCKGLLGRYARDRHVVDLCSFVWCFFVPGLLLSVIVNINFIVNQKVKTTGFSRSALAAKICCARGGAAWTTDMAAIRYFKSSTTLFG